MGEKLTEWKEWNFKVHSSFVVDFYDDVGVLTDVSTQVLFLPELLKSYFRVDVRQNSNMLEEQLWTFRTSRLRQNWRKALTKLIRGYAILLCIFCLIERVYTLLANVHEHVRAWTNTKPAERNIERILKSAETMACSCTRVREQVWTRPNWKWHCLDWNYQY